MTLTGTRSGAWLGGGASYSCGVLRWVYLLLVRSHLGHFMPSGGGCRLLWCFGFHLVDARSGGCSLLTSCPVASTDTSTCQQVLRSGSRKCVHSLQWRHPWWWVTQASCSSHRGAGRGFGGRDHGHVAHCWRCP